MEIFRALAALTEWPGPETNYLANLLNLSALPDIANHTELFLFQLAPYASVYVNADGKLGGEGRDRIAGFWRAIGQTPPTEPDHLAVVLALYAELVEQEEAEQDAARRVACHRVRITFLWEHVLSWIPLYAAKVISIATPDYMSWGKLLRDALLDEAQRIPYPARLPLHLREAPVLEHPDVCGFDSFLEGILAPAQSGIILTRADLVRAARMLNLGLRVGERAFMLRSLISQDVPYMFDWLAHEAEEWKQRHAAYEAHLGDVALFWHARAQATASLLRRLRDEAAEKAMKMDETVHAMKAVGAAEKEKHYHV